MRSLPLRMWVLAAASSLLQMLPFPIAGPVPLWRCAFCWVALVPLLLALLPAEGREPVRVRDAALLGYACGVLWYLLNCYWIYQTMYLYGGLARPVAAGILALFAMYLGLYHALFAALVVAVARSRAGRQGALVFVPFAWVAVELARSRITGFPWDLLGGTQVDSGLLTRLAPYTGVMGLSFVIAAVNSLWLLRIEVKERRHTRALLTAAGVVLVAGYVLVVRSFHPRVERATAVATLLQENLEVGAANMGPQESMEQMLRAFSGLSVRPSRYVLHGMPELGGAPRVDVLAGQAQPEVVIWPESPAPFEQQDPQFRAAMSSLAVAVKVPVIVGNVGVDPAPVSATTPRGYALHNSAMFVKPDGTVAGRYDKMHLVPFGEYVPFKSVFFFAGHLLDEVGTFEPGRERSVFVTDGHRFGTFICYESVFGDEVRQFVRDGGADVLVNLSNDGWYGDTSAPWQHLNMVRMRAIENHRWVLRATNTGVTAAIDPEGRVRSSAPRHVRTAIQAGFGYEKDVTFYAEHGDWFAYGCAAVTAAVLVWSVADRRRRHALES